MRPTDKIYFSPFLKLFPVVVLGVVLSEYFVCRVDILLYLLCCLSALCVIYIKKFADIYLYLCVFLFSFAMHSNRDCEQIGQFAQWGVVVEKPIFYGEEWTSYSAYLAAYKTSDEWQEAKGKVIVIAKNSVELSSCQQLTIKAKLDNDIYPTYKHQGYVGRLFLTSENLVAQSPLQHLPLKLRFAKLQQRALEKLSLLELSPKNQQVASTMILGYKPALDRELKQQYSFSGASHLLAVSGLHIGILFVLINLFLSPLKTLPWGHRIVNLVTIILIWGYALLTGLSPSALRAACMFTALQLALFSSLRLLSVNTLFAVASIMVLLDTSTLFDLSFQMSFLAVFFIVTLYSRLYAFVRTRFRWLNYLLQMLCLAFVSSVGIIPLSSYVFGVIPLWGVLLSPVLVALAGVVLWVGILWVLFPFYSMNASFEWLLNLVLSWQNNIVVFVSNVGLSHLNYSFSRWGMIISYVLLITFALGVWMRDKPQKNLLDEL